MIEMKMEKRKILDNLYLFRTGQLLRQWQIKTLFGEEELERLKRGEYAEYITQNSESSYQGLEDKRATLEYGVPHYDATMLKENAPILFYLYDFRNISILDKKTIEDIPRDQLRAGFFSGYLTHDSRGYRFVRTSRSQENFQKVKRNEK